MKKIVFGIDVSKSKLDVAVFYGDKCEEQFVVKNDYEELSTCFEDLLKAHQWNKEDVMLCAEHTGHYTYILESVATSLELDLWIENPTEIILSSGLHRGKNDKVDAYKIGMYAVRFQDRKKLYSSDNELYKKISSL